MMKGFIFNYQHIYRLLMSLQYFFKLQLKLLHLNEFLVYIIKFLEKKYDKKSRYKRSWTNVNMIMLVTDKFDPIYFSKTEKIKTKLHSVDLSVA